MLIIGRRLICPNLLDGIASLQASPSLGSISLRWFVSPLLPFRYLANTTQGDAPLLHAARTEARNSFQKNAMLSPNSPESVAAVSHAEEVAKILKQNVVQGKKEGEDLYSKSFQFELETVSWLEWTELRIHEHTERGDNDTIKMQNGKTVVIDGKTCADR